MNRKQQGFIGGGLNVYIIGILLAILVAGSLFIKLEFDSLKEENKGLIKDKQVLKADNERLIDLIKINEDTIKAMQADKVKSDLIIKNLRIQNGKDAAAMKSLREAIDAQLAADPSSNGSVAPVLKNTINSIQARRAPKVEVK